MPEVRLWTVDLDAPVEAADATLADQELERARGYGSDVARRRFVAGRAALRSALAEATGTPPRDLELEAGEHGKPRLRRGGPQFNLSHAGPLALIAVSDTGSVGVDVEEVRPRERLEAIARRALTRRERELLGQRRGRERLELFYGAWTAREAHLKALGSGFAARHEAAEAAPWPDGLEEALPLEGTGFWLRRLVPGPDHIAAVVAEGPGWRLAGVG